MKYNAMYNNSWFLSMYDFSFNSLYFSYSQDTVSIFVASLELRPYPWPISPINSSTTSYLRAVAVAVRVCYALRHPFQSSISSKISQPLPTPMLILLLQTSPPRNLTFPRHRANVLNNPALERFKTLEKVQQFVDMLKRYGCTQQQIAFLLKRQPTCLSICTEKIEPKILLLKDLGIHDEDLTKFVSRNPAILTSSLQRTLIPSAAFLQDVFKTRDLFIKAILRTPSILTYDLEKYLKPSVAFFEECGFVGEELSKLLFIWRPLLLCTCLTPAKADLLQKIGADKGSKMYKYVWAMVAVSRLETLEAKIDNFQQCGLTLEEAMELFRVCYFAYCISQERVRQHMDFIVNDMELPANSVLKWNVLLRYNLKVVKPRVLVLKRIQTLNNLGHLDIRGLASIWAMSEAKFVNNIITGHPESGLLNEVYQEAVTDVSETTKAGTKCFNENVVLLKMLVY